MAGYGFIGLFVDCWFVFNFKEWNQIFEGYLGFSISLFYGFLLRLKNCFDSQDLNPFKSIWFKVGALIWILMFLMEARSCLGLDRP